MFRTEHSVGMLKTIASIAGLAILLWSLGLPSLQFANAANITSVSDILSDSSPNAAADHEVGFTTPSGVANGGQIVIEFTGVTATGVDFTDIDVSGSTFGAMTVAADCTATDNASAVFSGSTLTITLCSGDGGVFASGETITLLIGKNATGGASNAQLTNPAAEGSYLINFPTVGASDSGATRVAILTAVTLTAIVDTIFNFTVSGVAAGGTVNGETITGTTGSTTIPFGKLTAGTATTSAQALAVTTNASNGYVITMQLDQPLQSSTGADIDGFQDGSDTNVPASWAAPAGTLGSENTYGHWGVTSDDTSTTRTNEFGAQQFIAASTSPRVIMSHTGPANNAGAGVGTTTVGYKIEISALQEAGDDYTTTLTYVATPTF